MATSTMKQKFLITNIGLLGTGIPGLSPGPGVGGTLTPDQQGVTLTASPVPLDPSQPTPAGVGPIQIPFLDPAAKDFFSVGMEVEFVVSKTAPAAASSGS